MKMYKVMLIAVASLTLFACAGGKDAPTEAQDSEEYVKVFQPDWYDLPGDEEILYTYGKAEKKSEEMAKDAAYANAVLEAANYIESYVKGMTKNFMEEAGVDNPQVTALTTKAVKIVSKAKFAGTSISKREPYKKGNNYVCFVRLSIPKDKVNKELVNSVKNEEALYNAFKASQAFKELEEETKSE